MSRAVALVLEDEGVQIPGTFTSIEDFRLWARSDSFPERGKIEWIEGEVRIEMSPEDLNTHLCVSVVNPSSICFTSDQVRWPGSR